MDITVKAIDRHRNGVGGEPFHVVLFEWRDDGERDRRQMMGIVFDESNYVAVLDLVQTCQGNIEFANGNSWRGDHFEYALRTAIAKHTAERNRLTGLYTL